MSGVNEPADFGGNEVPRGGLDWMKTWLIQGRYLAKGGIPGEFSGAGRFIPPLSGMARAAFDSFPSLTLVPLSSPQKSQTFFFQQLTHSRSFAADSPLRVGRDTLCITAISNTPSPGVN